MDKTVKRAALFVVIAGLLTLITFAIMILSHSGGASKPVDYPNDRGFNTAIIWFELIDTPEELFLVLGDPATDTGKELRTVMNTQNRLDYGFMVAYSLFYASLFTFTFVLLGQKRGKLDRYILYAGIALAVLMLLGDALENSRLLELTAYQNLGEVNRTAITMLRIWTRLKWFSLFIAGILLAAQYLRYFTARFAGVVYTILFLVPSIVGMLTFVIPNRGFFLESGSNLLGVAWVAALVHAGVKVFKTERDM